ncbi:hypothetical protein WICPIJ_009999 [Wickerhamomyces pijperi]|uniref:Uncharacterized protein n=1 Tax=Wickerhamomyces pijperi TaxID=599730 RepID=A0A9P8TAY3_WICPI|nr:hypothetical protein WICPIJ_009999 [Wickerhamomyces pijperi]
MESDQWLFSLDEIKHCPTAEKYSKEYKIRCYEKLTDVIIETGQQFGLKSTTICMALVLFFRYYQMEFLKGAESLDIPLKDANDIPYLSLLIASLKNEEKINTDTFFLKAYEIPAKGRTSEMIAFISGFSDRQKEHMAKLNFNFVVREYDKQLMKFVNDLDRIQIRVVRRMFEALSRTHVVIMFELDELVKLLVGLFCLYNGLDFSSFRNKVLKAPDSGQDEYVENIFRLLEAIDEFFLDHTLPIKPLEDHDYSIDVTSEILQREKVYDYFDLIFFFNDVPQGDYYGTEYCKSDYHTAYSGGASTNYGTDLTSYSPVSGVCSNSQSTATTQHGYMKGIICDAENSPKELPIDPITPSTKHYDVKSAEMAGPSAEREGSPSQDYKRRKTEGFTNTSVVVRRVSETKFVIRRENSVGSLQQASESTSNYDPIDVSMTAVDGFPNVKLGAGYLNSSRTSTQNFQKEPSNFTETLNQIEPLDGSPSSRTKQAPQKLSKRTRNAQELEKPSVNLDPGIAQALQGWRFNKELSDKKKQSELF